MNAAAVRHKHADVGIKWLAIYHILVLTESVDSVAEYLLVNRATVYRWYNLYKSTGDVERKTRGRETFSRAIDDKVARYVVDFVSSFPLCYQDEITDAVRHNLGVSVSTSTICRCLHQQKLTRKKITKMIMKRSKAARAWYRAKTPTIVTSTRQLVFLDETSKDARDAARLYGYSLKGTQCLSPYPNRGGRYSALALMDSTGFVHVTFSPGTFNRDRFMETVPHWIDKIGPYPGPNSVLVLDNSRIHKCIEFVNIITRRGAYVVFLPPYSPDFNPIETAFANVKNYLVNHFYDSYDADPIYALSTAFRMCLNDTQSLFQKCGY